jgi:hypothetical protein
MNDKRLKALVEHADIAPPAAWAASDLAARVRTLHRRRRRRRLAVAAAAFVAVSVLCGAMALRLADRGGHELAQSPRNAPAESPLQTARKDDSVREISRRIEREKRIVAGLLAAERRRRIETVTETAKIDFDRRLSPDDQVGAAAMALLLSAAESAKRPDRVAAAREDYVFVLRVFPNTVWATRAGQRLAAITP